MTDWNSKTLSSFKVCNLSFSSHELTIQDLNEEKKKMILVKNKNSGIVGQECRRLLLTMHAGKHFEVINPL